MKYRRKLTRKQSNRLFRRGNRVNWRNTDAMPLRGGYRL